MQKILTYLSLIVFIITLPPSLLCLISIPVAINPAFFWRDMGDLTLLIFFPVIGEVAAFFLIRRLLRKAEIKPHKRSYFIGCILLILLQIILFLPLLTMTTLLYVPLPPR